MLAAIRSRGATGAFLWIAELMPGPYSDEQLRAMATRYLDRWESDREAARDYVSAQSRWMVAQLFVANGGGLTALVTAEPLRSALPVSGPWFLGGVALSILCGLATWGHAQLVSAHLADMANPGMLFDLDDWPKPDASRMRGESIVHSIAVGAGVLSLIAFIVGAARAAL